MMALGDMNADIEIRAIRAGQLATFEVDGGFVRRPAPCDGLYIETSKTTILLPAGEVLKAMTELIKDRRKTQAAAKQLQARSEEPDR
jgi:hypothetical protein